MPDWLGGILGGGGASGIFGGGNSAGEMVGGGIGAAGGAIIGGGIGARIGSWTGRALGGMIRGSRSPEEFVDDMISEGRIPEFLFAPDNATSDKPVSRIRLVIAEQQSRGAGAFLDIMNREIENAVRIFNQADPDRLEAHIQSLLTGAQQAAAHAQNTPGEFEYARLLHDFRTRLVQLIRAGELESPPYQAGGVTAPGLQIATAAPEFNIKTIAIIAVGGIAALILMSTMR